jgi:glycosyltransferase involved in cell wall biosynthesis
LRQFLYITPYFAPQTQVGALRPLKFCRHLAPFGWQPVVLCDLWQSDAVDLRMLNHVPADVQVLRDYSAKAQPTWRGLLADGPRNPAPKREKPWHERVLPPWLLEQSELVPLGEHSPDMPHAYRAARHALERFPACEAIVVNADPFAASLVGARLSRDTGLPLVQDFRDIWAPCDLRRPRRLAPIRWLEDELERACLEPAAHVLINTQQSLADYRAHYPGLPEQRFSLLRNAFDRTLTNHGAAPAFDRFTLLHLGQFSRFRVADALVEALGVLVARGIGKEDLQIATTGPFGERAMARAQELGVANMVQRIPGVPYPQTGPLMAAADVLVYVAEPGATQRIASKLYDYLGSPRPILALSDNPESARLLERCGGGVQVGFDDIEGLADAIQAAISAGRQQSVTRRLDGLSAEDTARRLAHVLDAVTAGRDPEPWTDAAS